MTSKALALFAEMDSPKRKRPSSPGFLLKMLFLSVFT